MHSRPSRSSFGSLSSTESVSPSDFISNLSGAAIRVMWSETDSEALIPCFRFSVFITTFAGRFKSGTFGSDIPAVSTSAIHLVTFPTTRTRLFFSSSCLISMESPTLASFSTSLILSMSIPSSFSPVLYSSNPSFVRERSTIATWAGSTAFTVTPFFPILNFASSTRVEITSTNSLNTSAFSFASNMTSPHQST